MRENIVKKHGLTLIEVLVAINLASALFLILSLSLNQSLRAVDRGKAEGQVMAELIGIKNILWHELFNIYHEGEKRTFFQGDENSLSFLTFTPLQGLVPGGIGVVEFRYEDGKIFTKQRPFTKEEDIRDLEDIEPICLLENVDTFKITYLADIKGLWDRFDWEDHWKNRLPLAIKAEIKKGHHTTTIWVPLLKSKFQ
ncbi:MAG: hypothetical protein AMJ45_04340 [Syntrophobacter sp. DG_60]|nr:MAG: hypothetical protein AMJ45_04340 [Syntrophobacter sp. DG_60]